MNKIFTLLFLFLFLFACNNKEKKQQASFGPKVVEATGYILPKDSIAEPKTIPAGKPTVIKAGLPKVTLTNTNVHPAGKPKVVIAGAPKVCIPGKDTFLLPKTVPAIDSPFVAGIPETVIAKDMATKEQNPQNFSTYSKLQGLSNSMVRSMAHDKFGNIWFGTRNGLSRYDGKSFSTFTEKEGLANNYITCILEDKSGNLWFGTEGGGVIRYDGKSFTTFAEKEGLANNKVNSIFEDKSGNLWFGTHGGASKFNGNCVDDMINGTNIYPQNQQDLKKNNKNIVKSFTTFTEKEGLAGRWVQSFLEDKSGNLWIGTHDGGISKYDGKCFITYSVKEGLCHNNVWTMLEDKTGNLWFGTEGGGVSKYDGNCVDDIINGTNLYPHTQEDLKKSKKDLVKSFTTFTDKEGLADNTVLSMFEDKSGNLWFGTFGGGLSKYNGNSIDDQVNGTNLYHQNPQNLKKNKKDLVKSFTTFTEKEGLADNKVISMFEDKSGNLWFGTFNGASKYEGIRFTLFTDKEGLSNKYIYAILEDKSGNLWFGTFGGGVSKYDGKSFSTFTEKEGLTNNFVFSMLEDKSGNIWLGTINGLSKYDGKNFTNFKEKEGFPANAVVSMLEDKSGTLWFGTDKGVCRYDGNSFSTFAENEGLANNAVICMIEDRSGNIWFGANGRGLIKYDGNCVDDIVKGTKFYLHDQRDLKKNKKGLVKSFTSFTDRSWLVNNNIKGLLEDQSGNIWWGANGDGVNKYDGKRTITFTEKEGLASNNVQSILEDKSGNIWFGTSFGLSKLTSEKLIEISKKINSSTLSERDIVFKNYSYTDGFLGIGVNGGKTMMQAKDGTIWIGANDRLTAMHPENMQPDTIAPNIQITTIELYNENIAWAKLVDASPSNKVSLKDTSMVLGNGVSIRNFNFDGISKWYGLPENLSLAYNNNFITFNFIGITMNQPKNVKYQYILEGLDENWSAVSNKTSAPYGNLPYGTYTFKVKAMNSEGYWSAPFEYKFTIRPPFWQTWWFRALVVLLIVSSIWYFIKSREKKLVAEKEKLEKTVIERTAEVVEQKHLIEEKHKEITDSINYAERIQRSLLASKTLLDENLNEYFILFKPKAIVSGDFYWADCAEASAAEGNEEQFILVTADSTGHGVPGAIMSILNIACLDKAVTKGFNSPDLILNETRTLIIDHLKNDGSAEGGKDGMDGSLLSFDFKNNILCCACANNPVWIVRNSEASTNKELIEIKADRLPIGKHENDKVPFTLHKIDLQKGDVVYTLTDGFPDQFGGTYGKKFKHKHLQQLLLSIASEPMDIQKQKLNDVFDNWKGNLEQVDDVCLIGLRV